MFSGFSTKKRAFLLPAIVLAAILTSFPAVAENIGNAKAEINANGSDKGETALGDIVADAIRDGMGADAAFVHAGALSGALPKGAVSASDVQGILPLGDDMLVAVKMNAADIEAVLERSVGLFPKGNKGFLQVSGIKFLFDPSAPRNSRIVSWTINSKAPKSDAEYIVAVPAFLAGGGVGYKEFGAGKLLEREGLPLVNAVINYIKGLETLSPAAQGRITAKPPKSDDY